MKMTKVVKFETLIWDLLSQYLAYFKKKLGDDGITLQCIILGSFQLVKVTHIINIYYIRTPTH